MRESASIRSSTIRTSSLSTSLTLQPSLRVSTFSLTTNGSYSSKVKPSFKSPESHSRSNPAIICSCRQGCRIRWSAPPTAPCGWPFICTPIPSRRRHLTARWTRVPPVHLAAGTLRRQAGQIGATLRRDMKSRGCEISHTAAGATDAQIVMAIMALMRLAGRSGKRGQS